MLRRILLLTVIAMTITTAKAQVSFGEAQKFNDDWLFALKDNPAIAATEYDDSQWRKLNLPHDWSIEGRLSPSLASCTGYLPGGIGWYRKHFKIDDDKAKHYIYFEGVYNRSEVYLNGHLLGKRPNGYISFLYDMTPYLKEGDNVLAVKVDHSRYADSRWYTGSGIYRDVYLVSAPETHIAQWGVGYKINKLTDQQAVVEVDISVENPVGNLQTVVSVYDADKKMVATAKKGNAGNKNSVCIKIKKPHRWSLDAPYLYTLHTDLRQDGKVIDNTEIKIGLRTIDFNPDKGFALNGRFMKVKGVCLHHDAGVLGTVVPEEVWERRLRNLKKLGANAIRMSHNPQAPVVYDLCDRLGLLVMDEASDEWEFPKRKWIEGWNVGEPGYQGSFDFFEEWIERDVTDMVRRDRHHPSVFLWSIGNEVDYPNDPYSHPILDGAKINQPMFGGYKPDAPDARRIGKIAKRLVACVKAVDDSRPTTGALAGVIMSNETEYPEAVDIVGYNYTEDRYKADHATYPDRQIYGSETHSGLRAWKAVRDNDFIFGQFIWTGTDYLGESGAWPSRGLGTGLLGFGSFPKPRGYFQASLWAETPMAYIGTYPKADYLSVDAWDKWNYEPNQEIRVVCYTNQSQARLLLNGVEIGKMKAYDDNTGIIYWDVPFSPGTLTVEAYDNTGNLQTDYSIVTSKRPYAIQAEADRMELDDKHRIAHITVKVVDEDGNPVKLADNNIQCAIEGPAKLLGLENSDNSDMSEHRDNCQRVFNGQLLAYIAVTDISQPIRVRFSSPLLKSAEVILNAN